MSVGALYLFDLFGGPPVDWSGLPPLYTVVPLFIILTILAGIGEEFGWRGFLLPRLQTRYNALVSSLIVGVAWAIWHIPMFFIEGTSQYELRQLGGLLPAVLGFSLLVIVNSIQFAWVFNNTRGSVLLVAVLHGASNAWAGYLDPFRGYIGGAFAVVAVSALVTIIIVLIAGPRHLSRRNKRNVLELEDSQPDRAQASEGELCNRQAHDKGLLVKKLESEDGCQMLPMENTMITIYATTQKSLVSENETNLVWTAQRSDLEAFN